MSESEIGKKEECEFLQGNVLDFEVKKDDCEIRADISVKRKTGVRIWGRVTDYSKISVEQALVKLLRKIKRADSYQYEGIAHTVTDCEGFYQFNVDDCRASYRVIVSKAASGKERVIKDTGACDPCD